MLSDSRVHRFCEVGLRCFACVQVQVKRGRLQLGGVLMHKI